MGRLIEGFWDCPYCGTTHISGLDQKCPKCGKVRDASTKFYMDGAKRYISGKQEKKKRTGPDWLCTYCNSYNPAYEQKCLNCGHGRDEEDPDYFDVRDKKKEEVEDEPSPPLYSPPPKREPINHPRQNNYSKNNLNTNFITGLLLKFGIAAVIIGLLVFLLMPKHVNLTVESLSWDYSIQIQELLTFDESDWSLPSGGRLQYTNEELYGYEQVLDHYETKTRQVSEQVIDGYDEVVTGHRDLGNGTFEEITTSVPRYRTEYRTETYQEPVYRNEPIYRTKYYYEIDRWTNTRSVDTSGTDKEPYWGEVILGNNEREGFRNKTYTLFATDKDGKNKKYNLTEEEWRTLNVGDKIEANVKNIGNFELVLPN